MVAHLGHVRTKYVFCCFLKQKKILSFVSAGQNISLVVFPSKRQGHICDLIGEFTQMV